MTLDQVQFHPIYRAIQRTRRHSRESRGIETRALLLAIERSLLRAAALEGLCDGADACPVKETDCGVPARHRSACAVRRRPG
ncbi:MAG TPA: hypothetical protein VD978_08310 [Azospirillum sp.]|nr:hypothetical protein [Azospirillum sp.]